VEGWFGGSEESISPAKGIRGHRLGKFGEKLVDKLVENLEQPIIVPMHCKDELKLNC
jgi:hypothetical protein